MARVFFVVGGLLTIGLVISGVWLFLYNEPAINTEQRFQSARIVAGPRQGMEDFHGALADLAAAVALLFVIWWSYRVLADISWRGLLTLGVLTGAIISGGLVAVDAVVRDGAVVSGIVGHWPIMQGDYDFVAVGARDRGPTIVRILLLVHLLSLPVIAIIFATRRRGSVEEPRPDQSWIDQLDTP